MSPIAKLLVSVALIVGSASWLAYVGATTSWQYYLTADECIREAGTLVGKRMRVNGKVAAESLIISDNRKTATFDLQGTTGRLAVTCGGPLPDNLQEEMDVVVEGTLDDAMLLHGTKVLTRCASKYESRTE